MTDAGLGGNDTYRGEAGCLLGVPREQRQATATSEERYRQGRYDRTIRTRNGSVVGDQATVSTAGSASRRGAIVREMPSQTTKPQMTNAA